MKKKLPAFLMLLFAPSCIFVVSETHEAESSSKNTEAEESYDSDND